MLHNLIYYMLFRGNTNKTIWTAIVESTLNHDEVLPIIYYKPFKYSRFFLEHHHPDLEGLEAYVDKFFYAERYFN